VSDFAVDVKNLSVQFGAFFAVNGISFQVRPGEIFGFLGANGAGKTTTIRVLCGLLKPTTGQAFVCGKEVSDNEVFVKSRVGYMSQKFTLYNDLTVRENLDFIAALRNMDPKVYLERRKELFEFISFDKPLNTIVQELPGGIKQQVSLAASLLHNPDIIFLDEPTAGVSPASRNIFWQLIKKIAASGKTVFVTTHYMDEAEQCGRIALMRDGRIIALDTPAELKAQCFPQTLYEFDPIEKMNFKAVTELSKEGLFSYFEPYGLKFHAAFVSEKFKNQNMGRLERLFHVRQIQPSLEDVFIKSVESRPSGEQPQ
jgi:ABC-2 type transport system ATP-binding protein